MDNTVIFMILIANDDINNYFEKRGTGRILKINNNVSIDILKYEIIDQITYVTIYIDDFIKFHEFVVAMDTVFISYGQIRNDTQWKYMYYLVEHDRIDILDYLRNYYLENIEWIDMGDIFTKYDYDLVIHAAGFANIETFRYLFNVACVSIDNSKTLELCLLNTCKNGNYENAQLLLNKLKYPEISKIIALMSAVDQDHLNIIDLLVEHKTMIFPKDYFRDAFMRNSSDVALYFLSKGGSIDDITDDDVWHCIWSNHLDSMELLFNLRHFEQNEINDMFINAKNCTPEMVQLFLDNGANIEKYGKELLRKAKKCTNDGLAGYLKIIISK